MLKLPLPWCQPDSQWLLLVWPEDLMMPQVPESFSFLETLASGKLEGLMAHSQSMEVFILIH